MGGFLIWEVKDEVSVGKGIAQIELPLVVVDKGPLL